MKTLLAILTLALAALASPSSAELPDVPVETHCVADDTGAAHCSTTVAGTCTYTTVSGDYPSSGIACWHTAIGYCSVGLTPVQNPTNVWCENYQPPGDGSASAAMGLPVACSLGPMTPGGDTDCRAEAAGCSAHTHMYDVEDALNVYEASCHGCGVHLGAGGIRCDVVRVGQPTPLSAAAPPELPCQSGIAGSWCTVAAFDCKATVGYQTGGSAYQYAGAFCGPDLWYPCTIAYADTRGNVESCYLPAASASLSAAEPCQTGIAQTWCDFTVGPCDVRVTPWTAWGDQYVVADCATGGAGPRCHAEVHTQALLTPEHWCAF